MYEDFIIRAENDSLKDSFFVTVYVDSLDDHILHIKSHLKYVWKYGGFFHILKHFRLMKNKDRLK